MNIEIRITADESALEFSRNIGGIANFFKENLWTNALEEKGIAVREICEEENQKVVVPVVATAKQENYRKVEEPEQPKAQTIEPDPLPFSDEPAVQVSAEQLRAKGIAFSKAKGKDAMRLILDKLKVQKMSDLDAAGRALAAKMIDEASNA